MTELKTYPYIDPDEGLEQPTPDRRATRRRYYQKHRKKILARNKKNRDAKKTCLQRNQPTDQ